MNTYGQAFYFLKDKLQQIYDEQEAVAISHEVMETLTGMGRLERLSHKDAILSSERLQRLRHMMDELMLGRPIQYVTGVAYFMGHTYKVNEQVLIPRPETEELVQWISDDIKNLQKELSLLDIGTGSGCIAISLKLNLPHASITACDISDGALEIARVNAGSLGARINMMQINFLDKRQQQQLGHYDIIVSNPPYIPFTERDSLEKNVRDFEPGTALFVPDENPLLFYNAIADFGKKHLKEKGIIYCELHRDFAIAASNMFKGQGYQVTLRQDMHGNNRMLKAWLG